MGVISGGSAPNIVPDTVQMRAMMRNASPGTRKTLMEKIESTAKGIAAHNQKFMVEESYIRLCTRTMALLAVEYLNREQTGLDF